MSSERELPADHAEYNRHWMVKSLIYKPPKRPRAIKQKQSLPGQLIIPGLEGAEAERVNREKQKQRQRKKYR